jgi:hypothetical protein
MCLGLYSYAQEKKINLIISIDEKIPTSSINADNILIEKINGSKEEIKIIKYFQGNLIILESDYNKIKSEDAKLITLHLSYRNYCKGDYIDYSYEIVLEKAYFMHKYNICYIFNLDKKKYRKIYFPISNTKNYTYYFDYPSNYKGRLIQKKYTKEQKRCKK